MTGIQTNFGCRGIVGKPIQPKTSAEVLDEVINEQKILHEAKLNQKEENGTLTKMEKVDLAALRAQRMLKILTTPTVVYANGAKGVSTPFFGAKNIKKVNYPLPKDNYEKYQLAQYKKHVDYRINKGLKPETAELLFSQLTVDEAGAILSKVNENDGSYIYSTLTLNDLYERGAKFEPNDSEKTFGTWRQNIPFILNDGKEGRIVTDYYYDEMDVIIDGEEDKNIYNTPREKAYDPHQ